MKQLRHAILLALASLSTLSGCISSNKTEYIDEEKVAVTFESPKAEADFQAAAERRRNTPARFERPEERTTVFLVVVNVSRKKITSGPNRDFNQNVRLCDTDGNNIINEKEAAAFLSSSPPVQSRPTANAIGKTL